ncbi:MAG: carboxypeptidase regulatory-like domain-containing protein [Terracidiphilus sp.]
MVGAGRSLAKSLVWAAVLVAALAAGAQSPEPGTGSLAGRLTDLHSRPLGGATVVVRNLASGAEARTTTAKNGAYQFTSLAPGDYALTAETPEMGRGELEGIVVDAGHLARVQAAMAFVPLPTPSIPSQPKAVQSAAAPAPPRVVPPISSTPTAQTASSKTALETVTPAPERAASIPVRAALAETAALAQPPPARAVEAVPPASLAVAPRFEQPASAVAASSAASPRVEPTPSVAASAQPAPLPVSPATAALAARPAAPAVRSTLPEASAPSAAEAGPVPRAAAEIPVAPSRPIVAIAAPLLLAAAEKVARAAALGAIPPRWTSESATQQSGPVTPAVTTQLSSEQLQAVPVSGRRWQDFVLDQASSATPSAVHTRLSTPGGAELAVDGASTALAFGETGGKAASSSSEGGQEAAGMGRAWSGGRGFVLSETAVREVSTATGNLEAEAARAVGGRLDVSTRRGGNGLHGQGFVFERQSLWGAQNPFTQWTKETAPATAATTPIFTPEPFTPTDNETTWGIGLGRHIRRDRLFWFGALDSFARNDPGVSAARHPDVFFAQPTNDDAQVLAARLGLGGASPIEEGLAAYSGMLETLDSLLGPAPRTSRQWTGFGRIDWEAAERHRFTLEGVGARWNSPGGGLTRASETFGSHSFGSSRASEEWLLGRWEAFLTPNLLIVTQASAGRIIQSAPPSAPSAFEKTLLAGNAWGRLPQITVDSRFGFTLGNPARLGAGSYPDEHLYLGQGSVDWVHGSLLVRGGFELAHNHDAISLLRNQTGTYNYAHLENFISDALAFAAFGIAGQLNPFDQHNCDATGKVWRDTGGTLRGLGPLPCYSYYTQTMGPSQWQVSTNDWAGYGTVQWQPAKRLVLSAGLRWEREQLPPPIAGLANPDLPLTQRTPALGNQWGPRFSLAFGSGEGHWPVLRLGVGEYYGRTRNATLLNALTQTGSLRGDLNFFLRPTDNLNAGGAPPFPYVLTGEPTTVVKPGAVEFAPNFRNAEVHQAVVALEERVGAHLLITVSAVASLGRRLPVAFDANIDPAVNPGAITYGVVDSTGKGPIRTPRITVPFYASWPSASSATGFAGRLNPNYQQVAELFSRANSTYEAAIVRIDRYTRRGLSLHAHYTWAHAADWNPNESSMVAGNDVLDPANFRQEYGTSNLDVRHSATAYVVWEQPWKLRGLTGRLANGWMLSGVGQYRSGLPFTMRTAGSIPEEFIATTGQAIVGLGPGMNGSGGDPRVYGVGRNTFRYPQTWKADLRVGRRFDLGQMRQLELLAESFNLFNHQNVTEVETIGYSIEPGSLAGEFPTLHYLTGLKANSTAFGQPLNVNATDFFRERQIQFGLRLRF